MKNKILSRLDYNSKILPEEYSKRPTTCAADSNDLPSRPRHMLVYDSFRVRGKKLVYKTSESAAGPKK